jgi:hypothetical protein
MNLKNQGISEDRVFWPNINKEFKIPTYLTPLEK